MGPHQGPRSLTSRLLHLRFADARTSAGCCIMRQPEPPDFNADGELRPES